MKVLTPVQVVTSLLVLAAALALALMLGMIAGPSSLSVGDALAAVFGDSSGATRDIVLRVRLPRLGLAAIVGASLAVSGVLFQALLRNPLADPYVLGVSGGAALGGIGALALGSAVGWGYAAVPPAAFAGAVGTTFLLLVIAGRAGRVDPTSLLLTGVVFNAIASAAIVFLASTAGLTEGASLFMWLIGSLSASRFDVALPVALFLVAGMAVVWPRARDLNLLALGEESAEQLGVDVGRQQRVLLVAASLMVGAAVSVAGLVGFVGLIIPHLLRLALGADHRLLVPAAAIGGAVFLVLCDTVARTCLGGRELPVGAITALFGGPLFLVLLRRHYERRIAT